MNICLLIIAGILCALGVSECLECFNCLNIADPRACTNKIQCSNSESCYLETRHSGSQVLYNMGCQNNQLCSSVAVEPNGIIGRSIQTRQQYSCHECCGSNLCNEQLCSHRKPTSCINDPTLDCARLNSILNVCADVHHAKTICPQFCGLCQLVDGNWAAWGAWSLCSVTCNNGTQARSRTCSNPAPANSGLNCTGPDVESQMCPNQLCPVHGNWSDWSSWSNCSVPCNVGVRKKTRTCTNPTPDRSGNDCVGASFEYTVCLNEPCIVINGGWSSWGSWQSCSVTCGVGKMLRQRTCTNPSPSAYGKGCEGNIDELDICVMTSLTGSASPVVFHAHQPSDLSPASGKVIEYTVAEVNEGQGYNASNGVFTAPAGGLYMFTTQTCIWSNTFVLIAIVKEGVVIQPSALYHTSAGFAPCSSSQAFVRLFAGQRVWVESRRTNNGNMLYEDAGRWTSFSGVLLQA